MSTHPDTTDRLAALLAELCRREGLDQAETEAVVKVGLSWPWPRRPEPTSLLNRFAMAA